MIDANVLIAANNRGTHATLSCAAACGRFLEALVDEPEDIVLEDSYNAILAEYKRYCEFSGQPGVGDRFFHWFIRNRWTRVIQVNIGISPDDLKNCIPEPLHSFDASDHKWLAVYLRGDGEALYNATDSDYRESAAELSVAGIAVHELGS